MIAQVSYGTSSAVSHRFDQVAVAYVAGKGRQPAENQDSFWPRMPADGRRPVIDYLTAGRLYVVTDGVSKGLRPQEAARLAADTVGQEYYRRTEGWVLGRNPTLPLREAVMAAHIALLRHSEQLRDQGRATGENAYMQSTCVCVLILGDSCYTAHVGDSRAYLWRDGRLHQLTEDHADAEGRVSRLLGADLIPEHVTVTSRFAPDPEANTLYHLHPGDRLLLCSDGVHRFLSHQQINEILNRREGLASTAGSLADAVYERRLGHEDDLTLILIGIEYDPGRLAEREAQSASLRKVCQWREAVALAEEVAWWQPDFGAPQHSILRSLAELYVEAARVTLRQDRDESLGLRLLENAVRLGSAQGDRYLILAASYLKAAARWRACRGLGSASPEKEQAMHDLLAVAGPAVELFGPQAVVTACEAALELGDQLHQIGRTWDTLWYLARARLQAEIDESYRQYMQEVAATIRQGLLARQGISLQQALQAAHGPRLQDDQNLLAIWRQVCRALLSTTDPAIQNSGLARQVAELQYQLHERLVQLGHGPKLSAMYDEDVALFWGLGNISSLREAEPERRASQEKTAHPTGRTQPAGQMQSKTTT